VDKVLWLLQVAEFLPTINYGLPWPSSPIEVKNLDIFGWLFVWYGQKSPKLSIKLIQMDYLEDLPEVPQYQSPNNHNQ